MTEQELAAIEERANETFTLDYDKHTKIWRATPHVGELQDDNLALIAEVRRLEHKIMAIMVSVDKWLVGDELLGNEETGACDAREKALRMLEASQAEVRRLRDELAAVRSKDTDAHFPC